MAGTTLAYDRAGSGPPVLLGERFGAADLRPLDGVGHFSPAPQARATALTEVLS